MKLLLIALLAGCAFGQVKQKAAPRPESAITSSDLAEEPPQFKRKYSIKLSSKPGLTLSLECEDNHIWERRTCMGTLMQPDEKAAHFYIGGLGTPSESVAEHIFDPVIVPEVKRLTIEMYSADTQWRATNPQEFKTKDGNRWIKKAESKDAK